MALVVKDRVQEATTTSGTGTLTFTGPIPGYQTFSSSIGNGNVTFYTIYDTTAQVWEVGIGTVGAGTLSRDTVLSNSSGTTSPLTLAGNSSNVFCTYPAEKSINYDVNDVATIGEVLGYSDTGIIGSFTSTVAGYNQVVVQNKSTATNASSNFNVSNDAGTAGSNYAELGINSSTFTGTGSFSIAGASYVASASTDLTIGTYGAYSIHFVTNSNTTDAMTIYNNGGVSLGTFGNPGINNIAASKFVPGYSAITSAAGTTVLTANSNYYQNLLGSTTQTFELPDATTLLVGTTFIFDNNSSGALTVVDNASGPIETIPGGAAGFIYLANNSTVAGGWNRHAFLPATYDFNATTANFGTATITNATYQGNTIQSGYGGTGLTSFAAANNALYSTSSSALVAGTLPIAAGGTAATTFTANGVIYGNGTSALGVTAAGTTGQVLLANTSGAPTWGSVPSTGAVTSFQTSLSGLTPSTATTGAVTLAGTLGVTSGGTGTSTAFTTGSVVFAGASGTYTQDNANFFWDDTNNRLGIGTTSPTAKLAITAANLGTTAGSQSLYQILNSNDGNNDVLEISNTRQIAGSSWNGAGSRLQQKIDTTYMGYMQFNGGSGTTNDAGISFGTGSNASATGITERMRIDSSGNTTFSGPVLVNTGGGTALTLKDGGDFVMFNAGNTISNTFYINGAYGLTSNSGSTGSLISPRQYYVLNADRALSSVITTQSIFGVGATLAVGRYMYRIQYIFSKTLGTGAIQFAMAGGATTTLHQYQAMYRLGATAVTVAAVSGMSNRLTTGNATLVTISGATVAISVNNVFITGVIDVTVAGTVNPQIAMTVAPGTFTILSGSHVEFCPVSATGANTSVGTWA